MKDRKDATRRRWLEVLEGHRLDWDRAGAEHYWSPRLDTAPRAELRHIQNTKLAAAVPFLYENSPFYRRRFERLGMTPDDVKSVALPVLRHRLTLAPELELEGITTDSVLTSIVQKVEAPRE